MVYSILILPPRKKEKAAVVGIKGYLMKPVVMKELSSVIRKVIDDQEG